MANTLSSYDRATLVEGQTSGGVRVPFLVDANGVLQTSGAASAGSGTFATIPAASGVSGQTYFATDLGTGILLVSTGTKWKPVTGIAVIAQANPGTSVTNTAAETNLATITIPAGLLSTTGVLRGTMLFSNNSSAGIKTSIVRLSATSGITGNSFYIETAASLTGARGQFEIRNNGSLSSQIGGITAQFGFGANALSTATINTAIASFLNIDGSLATTTDTLTLVGYTIEWLES